MALIKDWLARHDILLAGRYSEWEYYNSDHAFIAGKKAAETVLAQRADEREIGRLGLSERPIPRTWQQVRQGAASGLIGAHGADGARGVRRSHAFPFAAREGAGGAGRPALASRLMRCPDRGITA